MDVRRPVNVLAAGAVLIAGCTQHVEGSAKPATTAVRLLPGDEEITKAAGNGLSTFGFHPFVGGPEILPDGFRTDADASPITCIGVTDTTTRVVYESTPMVEAARQSYFTLDENVGVTGADAAVIRMASDADAQRVFDDSVRQWRACDGKTVEKRLRGVTGTEVFADVGDVEVAGALLTATLHTHPGPNGPTSSYRRVLGVHADTIVEVSLAVTPRGAPGSATYAAAVAQTMLGKVGEPG